MAKRSKATRNKRRGNVRTVRMFKNYFNNKCQYCFEAPAETLDHIIPLGKGGKDEWSNLIPACKKCNEAKRDNLPRMDEYKELSSQARMAFAYTQEVYRRKKRLRRRMHLKENGRYDLL